MNTRVLIRCVVISLAIALVVPALTFQVGAPIGPDGAPMSPVGLTPSTVPFPEFRELFGLEKYRYMFTAGSWLWWLYLKHSAIYFLIAFVSSLGVSIWNTKQRDA